MLRSSLGGFLGTVMFAGVAVAATCVTTMPDPLSNGNTTDATQVTADLIWANTCIGGSPLQAAPDGRIAGVSFEQTQANNYAWLTLLPSGTSTESGFRLYNAGNFTNVVWVDFFVNGTTATINSNVSGSGAKPTSIQIGFSTVLFPSVGTTSSSANAYLNSSGDLLKMTSSMRYKRDIRPLSYDEERKVLDLIPVSFHSQSPADDPNQIFNGLTAEQVAQHLPQFVNYIKGPDGKDIPDGVQYDRIAAVALLGVVKHQQQEIDALRACRLWCMVREAVGVRAAP